MGGEVCYVHSTPTVIDYGIGAGAGAGADSIMLCLDTRSENLVKIARGNWVLPKCSFTGCILQCFLQHSFDFRSIRLLLINIFLILIIIINCYLLLIVIIIDNNNYYIYVINIVLISLIKLRQELGFPGVEIGSHINNWNLDAPELDPVFAVSNFYYQCIPSHDNVSNACI